VKKSISREQNETLSWTHFATMRFWENNTTAIFYFILFIYLFIYFLDPFDFCPLCIFKEMITQTCKELLERPEA